MGIAEGQDILHLCQLQRASYYATIEFEMGVHVLDLPGQLRVCRTRVGAGVEGGHTMTQIKKWTVVSQTTSAPPP